jgi:predicted nuclease of predicted toxin-antitoxin system
VRRARDVGIQSEDDAVIVEYALANDLVIVTHDFDLRDSSLRALAPACISAHQNSRLALDSMVWSDLAEG